MPLPLPMMPAAHFQSMHRVVAAFRGQPLPESILEFIKFECRYGAHPDEVIEKVRFRLRVEALLMIVRRHAPALTPVEIEEVLAISADKLKGTCPIEDLVDERLSPRLRWRA